MPTALLRSLAPLFRATAAALALLPAAIHAQSQSIAIPWSNHGHDAQHSGISQFAAQPMNRIRWHAPVDLQPQYQSGSGYLLTHYGSPLVTRLNSVVLPVKTGATDGFRVDVRTASDGTLLYTIPTDYSVPVTGWIPMMGCALTPRNRLYVPGIGGTVIFRDDVDNPNAAPGASGRLVFFGAATYDANPAAFNANIKINTPITSDRYGNIYFGFRVYSAVAPFQAFQGGIARIAEDGTGSWVSASVASGGIPGNTRVATNSALALSVDHKTFYALLGNGSYTAATLAALDSRTLGFTASVALKDPKTPANAALVLEDGTSSPCVGPDGDVYVGVQGSPTSGNAFRGWMMHLNGALTQLKTPGAFGWDDTPSIIPRSCVPSYNGSSSYLLLSKYNSYFSELHKVAVLDPNATMVDPISGATVMNEVMTKLGPTIQGAGPGVYEWCINAAAVDPATKSAILHSEDGKAYRWDLTTNTLTETLVLTQALGEAYTSTVIGVDGTVYIIGNGLVFAIGQ